MWKSLNNSECELIRGGGGVIQYIPTYGVIHNLKSQCHATVRIYACIANVIQPSRMHIHNFACDFIMMYMTLKVKTSIGNAQISKNEMEALITNHVKEYVLTNT